MVQEALKEERIRMLGEDGKVPFDILYWAMMEEESDDPVQHARWDLCRSHDWISPQPMVEVVEVMMVMQAPGRRVMRMKVQLRP